MDLIGCRKKGMRRSHFIHLINLLKPLLLKYTENRAKIAQKMTNVNDCEQNKNSTLIV